MWGGGGYGFVCGFRATILGRIRPYTHAEIATNLLDFLSDSGILSNQMTVNIFHLLCPENSCHHRNDFGSYLRSRK